MENTEPPTQKNPTGQMARQRDSTDTRRYVVGFMFDTDFESVALIRKNKPAWQAGKLNGIGGKIEGTETPEQAMWREGQEEAGIDADWNHFCSLSGTNNDGGPFQLETLWSCGDLRFVSGRETEEIELIPLRDVVRLRSEMIGNLPWLIELARDFGTSPTAPRFVIARYGPSDHNGTEKQPTPLIPENPSPPSPVTVEKEECPRCEGTGWIQDSQGDNNCQTCNGFGVISSPSSKKDAVSATTVQEQAELLPCPFGPISHQPSRLIFRRVFNSPSWDIDCDHCQRIIWSRIVKDDLSDSDAVRAKLVFDWNQRAPSDPKATEKPGSFDTIQQHIWKEIIREECPPAPVASVEHKKKGDLGIKDTSTASTPVLQMARALIDQLDLIHDDPSYKAVWFSASNHGLIYEGPTYERQLLALRDAVEAAEKLHRSERPPKSDSASGVSSPNLSASIEHVEQEEWEVRYIPDTLQFAECWELHVGDQCVAVFSNSHEPRDILRLHNASIERAVKQQKEKK